MEYVQMTLTDWEAIKDKLEYELRESAAGFVRIGYLLRQIEDCRGYENDGFDTLTDWAKSRYNLSSTAVSRFMSINKKYSIDGYSDRLKLEFAPYGFSKLTEMLHLPDSDMEMVSPEMRRDDIREIKRFSKDVEHMEAPAEQETAEEGPAEQAGSAPAAGIMIPIDPNHAWIVEFFRKNGEILNELYCSSAFKNNDIDAMKEIINPAGSRVFRHKLTMVSMLDNRIMVKIGMGTPAPMSWMGFFDITFRIFKEVAQGPGTYRNAFGTDPGEKQEVSEDVRKKATEKQEMPKDVREMPKDVRKVAETKPAAGAKEPAKAIAPAQLKEPENTVNNNEKADSTIAEEAEQVEIDEILPAPVEMSKLEELKDRFREALNTLKVMVDAENFERMDRTIERLGTLKIKMIAEKQRGGEE